MSGFQEPLDTAPSAAGVQAGAVGEGVEEGLLGGQGGRREGVEPNGGGTFQEDLNVAARLLVSVLVSVLTSADVPPE